LVHAGNLTPHYTALAAHYRAAGAAADASRSIDFSVLAAEACRAVFAWEEAAAHYDGALQVFEFSEHKDHRQHCDLLLGLGESLVAAGERERIFDEVAPAALALADALGDRARAFAACRVAMLAGTARAWAREGSGARDWLETAERYLGDDLRERIELTSDKPMRTIHEGRADETRRLLLEALSLARDGGEEARASRIAFSLFRVGVLSSQEERLLFEEVGERPKEGSTRDLAYDAFDALLTHLQWGERAKAEGVRAELANLAARTRHNAAIVALAGADAAFAMLDGRLLEAAEATVAAYPLGSFPHAWRGRPANWLADEIVWEPELAHTARLGPFTTPSFKAFLLAQAGRLSEAREVLSGSLDQVVRVPQVALN
jgi:hypothetical protein